MRTTTTTTTPNGPDAIAYVRRVLANSGDVGARILGTVAPGRDSSGPLDGTRDVLFAFPGDAGRPYRFTVWNDGDSLYGEW